MEAITETDRRIRETVQRIRALCAADNDENAASELRAALDGLRTGLLDVAHTLLALDSAAEQAGAAYRLAEKIRGYTGRDYALLCDAALYFLDSLGHIDTARLGRLMNRVRMGYFPTDLAHVAYIRQAIAFPEEPVNMLDPCCGEGLALEALAAGRAVTYGIEIDELRAQEATGRLNRVGMGSFFHAQISWRCFHALFLNPPYLKAGNRRLEKAFLAESLRYLTPGGLLIYIVPYYLVTEDVCQILCENFEQLRVYRFMDDEFAKWRQVVFLGHKRARREAPAEARALQAGMFRPDRIPLITGLPAASYALPAVKKPVSRFSGAVFNTWELAEQLKASRSMDGMFCRPAEAAGARHPLLPLNLSQIGLVGASGMLNGLVQGTPPHIVKGCMVKNKTTAVLSEDEDAVREQEITSNKLIFNILAPDGFHSLR